MNHDACHCLDYAKYKCPKKCYRAELTEELFNRSDLIGIPFTWSHLLGTKECMRLDKYDKRTEEYNGNSPT